MGLLNTIKQKLEKTKYLKNVNFCEKDFKPYKKVPCLEFNLVSKNHEKIINRIYSQFTKEIKRKISDLTIIYNTPDIQNNPNNFRRIRLYIKNRNENEKQQVLEKITEKFSEKLSAYIR